METHEIFAAVLSLQCPACDRAKKKHNAFCLRCYRQLPNLLKHSLWGKRIGQGYEEAYCGCLSWFRLHPLPVVQNARQKALFEDAS